MTLLISAIGITDEVINNYIDNHVDAHKSDNIGNISLD